MRGCESALGGRPGREPYAEPWKWSIPNRRCRRPVVGPVFPERSTTKRSGAELGPRENKLENWDWPQPATAIYCRRCRGTDPQFIVLTGRANARRLRVDKLLVAGIDTILGANLAAW